MGRCIMSSCRSTTKIAHFISISSLRAKMKQGGGKIKVGPVGLGTKMKTNLWVKVGVLCPMSSSTWVKVWLWPHGPSIFDVCAFQFIGPQRRLMILGHGHASRLMLPLLQLIWREKKGGQS